MVKTDPSIQLRKSKEKDQYKLLAAVAKKAKAKKVSENLYCKSTPKGNLCLSYDEKEGEFIANLDGYIRRHKYRDWLVMDLKYRQLM